MKKKFICIWICICLAILAGCSHPADTNHKEAGAGTGSDGKPSAEISSVTTKKPEGETLAEASPEPVIVEEDWSEYFDGRNGAAVLYHASGVRCRIYNKKLAMTRRSPCSTFKIISSLIALETGLIDSDHSTRRWSGEKFWNESWNHDIDFREAFRTSCVWYYREVINEIGKEQMQKQLDALQYGNCDISDWKGKRNKNNSNRALTGFWIESSLKISPKEQAEVMERIFGDGSVYSRETQKELRRVMLAKRNKKTDLSIYGKTGMGVKQGSVVDAWFTGFAEMDGDRICFSVYLGRTKDRMVSSDVAKKIAIEMVSDYFEK